MKPLEEAAAIRYIENNQYQLTIKQVAECFDVAMSTIKNVLHKNKIKLKYERNVNQTMKHVNEELKKNKEKTEDLISSRKVDPAHITWYRNNLNINLNLAKNGITVKHTDTGLEDVWDKIKHEYVYKVICPFERTYEIKRRLSDEKLQANSIRRDSEGQKSVKNKESVAGVGSCDIDSNISNKRVNTKFKKGNNMSKINQETKDKFIVYYLEQKKLKKMKKEIATEQTLFSFTTANRIMLDVDSWTKGEWKEFEARQAKRTKEEPVSEIEQFEEEETEILDEIAAKNKELQKELHTQKVVIETLQNGVDELNETITESKCMIAEVAKERDDKDEEIRVLNLELQKYKNDIETVMNDRQYLEGLLPDSASEVESIAEFRKIIEEMIQLYKTKNKDYGNAFSQSYNEFGSVMSVIRINDKLNRFKTLIKQNNEVKTESIKDTLIDLANYAVMTIIEIERENVK